MMKVYLVLLYELELLSFQAKEKGEFPPPSYSQSGIKVLVFNTFLAFRLAFVA